MVESPTTIGNPILANLFRQNQWANLELIDACAGLDPSLLDGKELGAGGPIRSVLWHVIDAEHRFVAALNGEPKGDIARLAGFPDGPLATLRVYALESGEGLIAWAEGVNGDPMVRAAQASGPDRVPASILAGHALLHATAHRARIQEALRRAGVTPPDLTVWAWWKAVSETGIESPTI